MRAVDRDTRDTQHAYRPTISTNDTITMSDTPTYKLPVDPQEQPILDAISHIRDELSLLKADRSTYIRSEDIVAFYDQLIDQVHRLNNVRRQDDRSTEQNRGKTTDNTLRGRRSELIVVQ